LIWGAVHRTALAIEVIVSLPGIAQHRPARSREFYARARSLSRTAHTLERESGALKKMFPTLGAQSAGVQCRTKHSAGLGTVRPVCLTSRSARAAGFDAPHRPGQ